MRNRWPIIDELCRCAEQFDAVELWAFGSMLSSETPRDLDVLIIYSRLADVIAIREMGLWELVVPAVDIIAMRPDEERHYRFIDLTRAIRLLTPEHTAH